MNIGNITSNNFNLNGIGKDIQIEVYEQLIGQLQQENKILKDRIEYLERSNNRREDTILEQRQEISDLEDNWNKLKEIVKSQSSLKQKCHNESLWFEVDELLNKIQELEGDSNEQ